MAKSISRVYSLELQRYGLTNKQKKHYWLFSKEVIKSNNSLKYQINIFAQLLIWVTLRKHEEGHGSLWRSCKALSCNLGPSIWNNHQFSVSQIWASQQTGWKRGTHGRHEWRCRSTRQNVLRCDLTIAELFSSVTKYFVWQNQPLCQLWWQLHPVRKRQTELQRANTWEQPAGWNFFFFSHKMCRFKWNSDKSTKPKTQRSSFRI